MNCLSATYLTVIYGNPGIDDDANVYVVARRTETRVHDIIARYDLLSHEG